MAKSSRRGSIQKNVSIPPAAWKDIEEAMRLDGLTSFSQFALAAIVQRATRVRRQHELLDAKQIAELAPKIRALLADLERNR